MPSTFTVKHLDGNSFDVAQRVLQRNGNGFETPSESQTDETNEAIQFADEIGGESEFGETGFDETNDETNETAEHNAHTPVSSPAVRVKPLARKEADSESDEINNGGTEFGFEAVEGFDENQFNESSESDENAPLTEAFYADAEASEEFFPALGALMVPIAKAVLPALASAVVKQGATSLTPRMKSLFARLSKLGIRPPVNLLKRGYGNEFSDEFGNDSVESDEMTITALERQLENLEVVIGKDDRVQVKTTKILPWNRICHLKIKASNGKNYLGTGFLVNRRTIITAGHCVYIHGQGGWAQEITVTPGRNSIEEPYSKVTATSFRSVKGWVKDKSRNYDYGAIILPKAASFSTQPSSFAFARYADSFLLSKRLNTAGYPGDKPAGTIWYHGLRAKAVNQRTIVYDIDTYGGQSGSPVWIYEKNTGKRIVVGIHTNGSPTGNSATRITAPVYQNLARWRAEGA